MEHQAEKLGVPFEAFEVIGADHFNILAPLTKMVAEKIKADSGPECNIKISRDDVTGAMRKR